MIYIRVDTIFRTLKILTIENIAYFYQKSIKSLLRGSALLKKSIFFPKIDFEISIYTESPKCLLSDYVCFVAL